MAFDVNKLVLCLVMLFGGSAFAQSTMNKPKMIYMGAYDSGQAGASIHKLFDPTDEVVCYLLMPDQAGRREGLNGGWIYEGNSIGSMSCLKTQMQISGSALSNKSKEKSK